MPPKPPANSKDAGRAYRSRNPTKTLKPPKAPLPTAEKLQKLFGSLVSQIEGGHWRGGLRTCDKILRLSPSDSDAIRTKIFLLLQMDMYNDALEVVDSLPEETRDTFAFDKAYALYRVQREDEALDVLNQLKQEDRGVMHLEAQLNYRQGNYQSAYEIYEQLLESAEPNSEEHTDISTNLLAAETHLSFITSGFLSALDSALPASVRAGIEESGPPPAPSGSNIGLAATVLGKAADKPSAPPIVKKPRTKRIPPNITPGVSPAPDPERWLKKSERTGFRDGKKRKGQGGATQGGGYDVASVDTKGGAGAASGPTGAGKAKGKKKK